VREVAGVLVGHARVEGAEAALEIEPGDELGDVLDEEVETLRPLRVLGVVAEQLTVFFQRRAAAGGVDDD